MTSPAEEDYSDLTRPQDFFGFSNGTQIVLSVIARYLRSPFPILRRVESVLCIVGIVVNALSIVVLTRKSMRSSSINIFLVGISVSEIFYLSYALQQRIDVVFEPSRKCQPPPSLFAFYVDGVYSNLCLTSSQSSSWFGMSLAIVRTLVARNVMNPRYQGLMTAKAGLYITCVVLLLVSVCFVALSLINTAEIYFYWTPKEDENCIDEHFPADYTVAVWVWRPLGWRNYIASEILTLVAGVLGSLVPCLFFPLSSILLIIEIRKARKSRERLCCNSDEKRKNTTTMVALITVTFVMATLPEGIVSLIHRSYSGNYAMQNLLSFTGFLLASIRFVTSPLHVLICFCLSSDYREAAYKLFRFESRCRRTKAPSTFVSTY